jgi:cyclic pyranopterin phosphate synthase
MDKERLKKIERTRAKLLEKGLSPEGFCIVPFTNLILEPDGSVGVCRHKGTEFTIGHIEENSISEIWNNHFIKRWRSEFLKGEAQICAKEIPHMHCNLCPHNNELLDDVIFSEHQDRPFIKLTANFNGRCNLQCQMCHVWKMPNGLYDKINFWGPAQKDIFPYVKEIDMLSGEPFIQPDTYRLIDAVSSVNPSCRWMLTTNAHWKLNQKIKDALNKIDIKYIVLSIDSLNTETYHKIRYPGDLQVVLKNIDALLEYNETRPQNQKGKIPFHLNFLVQKDNWKEVPNALNFCDEKGIIPFITFLYEPTKFSLLTEEDDKKEEVFNFFLENLSEYDLNRIMRILIPLASSLKSVAKAQAFDQLKCLRLNVKEKLEKTG